MLVRFMQPYIQPSSLHRASNSKTVSTTINGTG
nr:MAG TPA: hypothetical protein [Caudoviricetes sp.]